MGCEEDFDLQELQGEECYGGWTFQELATLRLWRSFSLRKLLVEFWTPKDTLLDRAKTDRVPYDAWEREAIFIPLPERR